MKASMKRHLSTTAIVVALIAMMVIAVGRLGEQPVADRSLDESRSESVLPVIPIGPDALAGSGSPQMSGSGLEDATAITGTVSMRRTNGDWVEDELRYATVKAADNFIQVSEHFMSSGELREQRLVRVSGARWVEITRDGKGEVLMQRGALRDSWVPREIAYGFDADRAMIDERLERLVSGRYPVVDLDEVSALQSEDLIWPVRESMWIGVPAIVVSTTISARAFGVVSHTVWIDRESGIKLRSESSRDGISTDVQYRSVELGVGIAKGQSELPADALDPTLVADVPTGYYESMPFNPDDEQSAPVPESEQLIFPSSQPVSGTLALQHASFITGTVQFDRVDIARDGMATGWAVAAELVDEGSRVLILQSRKGMAPLGNVWYVWPLWWESTDELDMMHLFQSPSIRELSDGTDVTVYPVDRSHIDAGTGVPIIDFDYMASFEWDDDIQVTILEKGISGGGVIPLLEAIVESSN